MARTDRAREPGRVYLRLMRRCYGEELAERVFAPAVADLQHEWGEAAERPARLRVRMRGYVALARLAVATPFIAGVHGVALAPGPLVRLNGQILLVLAGALYLGTVTVFGAFTVPSWAAGIVLAVLLRRWHLTHPSTPVEARIQTRVPVPEINFYSISAGGDVAGLMFAAGSISILVVGLPQFAWYLAVAALAGLAFAVALHARREAESKDTSRLVTIAQR